MVQKYTVYWFQPNYFLDDKLLNDSFVFGFQFLAT